MSSNDWPDIAVITPGGCSLEQMIVRTQVLYAQGMRMLVLREPTLSAGDHEILVHDLGQACPELRLIHHFKCPGTRALLEQAPRLVHLPAFVEPGDVSGLGVHGVSVHSEQELGRAIAGGASYAMLAPVWSPNSKPGDLRATLGAQGYEQILAKSTIPLYALGGVNASRIAPWKGRAGIRVALIGELFTAPQERAVESFVELHEQLSSC